MDQRWLLPCIKNERSGSIGEMTRLQFMVWTPGTTFALGLRGSHCTPRLNLLISSFHGTTADDSVLLSLDFPSDSRPHDFYRIVNQGTLRLDPNRRRMCCDTEPKRPTLAISVTPHGNRDLIAVLTRDGLHGDDSTDRRPHYNVPRRTRPGRAGNQ